MTLVRTPSFGSFVILLLATASLSAQEPATQEAVEEGPRPSAITHASEGKTECLVCHAPGATPITDVTPSHEGKGKDNYRRLNEGNVICGDRLDNEPPHPGPGKDRLYDHSSP